MCSLKIFSLFSQRKYGNVKENDKEVKFTETTKEEEMSFYSFMFICKEEPPLHCCNVQSDLSQQEKEPRNRK